MDGITIERRNGMPTFVRIDLRKYGSQLAGFFKKNKVELANQECQFDDETMKQIELARQEYKEGKCICCNTHEELEAFLESL